MTRFHLPPVNGSVGDALVRRGFLEREEDVARADLILVGGAFRYTPALWEHLGANPAGPGGGEGVGEPGKSHAEAWARLAAEWVGAGAPEEWARMEASAALARLP